MRKETKQFADTAGLELELEHTVGTLWHKFERSKCSRCLLNSTFVRVFNCFFVKYYNKYHTVDLLPRYHPTVGFFCRDLPLLYVPFRQISFTHVCCLVCQSFFHRLIIIKLIINQLSGSYFNRSVAIEERKRGARCQSAQPVILPANFSNIYKFLIYKLIAISARYLFTKLNCLECCCTFCPTL